VIALVGGGPAGFEMALALAARLGPRGVRILLVTGAAGLLPALPRRLRGRAAVALTRRGVMLVVDDVAEVTAERLRLTGSPDIAADAVLWATGAAPPAWLDGTALARDARGFVAVDATLRSTSHPGIFAAGDVAGFAPPLPKSGVVAVRQGPLLARNLRAAAEGGRLERYRPQRDWLVLLSLGDGRALGTRNGLVAEGRWVWWWKDWIDRRFMARYRGEA
jgi:selenide,water dikinase